jgi:type IV secretory pathway TrbF-like protein
MVARRAPDDPGLTITFEELVCLNAFRRAERSLRPLHAGRDALFRARPRRDRPAAGADARARPQSWRLMAFGCLALAFDPPCTPDLRGSARPPASPPMSCRSTVTGGPGRIELAADRVWRPEPGRDRPISPADFVELVRAKSTDPIVLRQQLDAGLRHRQPATLSDHPDATTPRVTIRSRGLARRRSAVEIVSVLPRWPRQLPGPVARDAVPDQGAPAPSERWTGLFSVRPRPARDEAQLLANPTGLEITSFQWSREL